MSFLRSGALGDPKIRSVTEADLLKELGKDGLAALKGSLKRSRADDKAGRTHALEELVRDRDRRRSR